MFIILQSKALRTFPQFSYELLHFQLKNLTHSLMQIQMQIKGSLILVPNILLHFYEFNISGFCDEHFFPIFFKIFDRTQRLIEKENKP